MPIIASSGDNRQREIVPAGNYVAICYEIIHIGTVADVVMGEHKLINKVRIGWELPIERRVFDEEKGLQPFAIFQKFTLSLHEKSSLRKTLASWRGRDFTEQEAKAFDITVLAGKPCMINIIHKPSKADPSRIHAVIGAIGPVPKGIDVPKITNPIRILSYDNFDFNLYNSLPEWLRNEVASSVEFKKIIAQSNGQEGAVQPTAGNVIADEDYSDDLPF